MRISDWSSDVCSSDLNGACPLTASAEPVKLNQATRDQVAAVMLQTGTPERQEEALRYAGVEPVKGEPSESPTKGMNLGARIAHVGGRTHAQGYTEFGSPMAGNALSSEERCVGKEWVSTCRSRWSPEL